MNNKSQKNIFMTMYYNTVRERAMNTEYPIEKNVCSIGDLREVVSHDHVCARYKFNRRKIDNFERADCCMLDIDNMETDDPAEWIYPKDIVEKFPDVPFYIVHSRNHMKAKGGKSPRPKFHVYFPIESINDAVMYRNFKDKVCTYFPSFDQNAKDSARFFFGVENPEIEFYDGEILLSDFMKNIANEQNKQNEEQREDESMGNINEEIIPEGQRNNTLCSFAARALKRWGENDEKAYELFRKEAEKCRPLLEEKELNSIWYGALKFYREKISTNPEYVSPETYAKRMQSLKPFDFTDVGQAKVFQREYGNITAYSLVTRYLYYNGKVWLEDDVKVHGLVQELTERQLKEAYSELRRAQEEENEGALEKDTKTKKDGNTKVERAKNYRNYALGKRDSRDISGVLKEIQPMISIDTKVLDKDEFLLNTPDGTVDLRTGKIRNHDSKDYCTKITKVSPSEEGSKLFKDFLNEITCSNEHLQNYLQLIAGEAAIGKVYDENLIIACGAGKNGKSTFFNLISKVMGDYAGHLSAETIVSHPTKNKSPEYAELRGKRFVTISELDEDKYLDTALIKKLCSTDDIFAEKKYKAPFAFTPSHTIILCTNHLPQINVSDEGTWRRLVVVPFDAVIDQSSEVKNYAEYLLEHAGGAVLSWIIEGARLYIESGYKIDLPEVVKTATEQYRSENDWIHNYVSERCEVGRGYEISAADLYMDYVDYCEDTGEYKKSKVAFGKGLSKAGFLSGKRRIGGHEERTWKGLKVISPKDYRNEMEVNDFVIPYVSPKSILTDRDTNYNKNSDEEIEF